MRATTYLWLLLWVPVALAQGSLEILPLKHRTAEQVIPVLRPLLEPGGSLSGQSGQLFVRTSERNLAEIRAALAAIDTPARRLQISVRFDEISQGARGGVEAAGRISNRGDSRIELRIDERRSSADERVDQRLQVQEGGRARISTGASRPLRQREVIRTPGGPVVAASTVLQQAESGFDVIPRVSGSNVFLEIAQQRESLGPAGTVRSGRVAASVSGRLGEWLELGGVESSAERSGAGILSQGSSAASGSRRIWVKVEEIKP